MPPVTILSEEEVPAGAHATCLKFFYKSSSRTRTSELWTAELRPWKLFTKYEKDMF